MQNPRHTRLHKSLKDSNYVNGEYAEDFRQTEQKEACDLTSSRIPGRVYPIVSLFRTLGRLCHRPSARNVAAVPYNAGSGDLCNGVVSEKSPQIYQPPLPA